MMDSLHAAGLTADVGAAARSVARRPRLFLLLAVVIGLGVGATTAVFALLRPLLLAPLPFEASRELVWIANTGEGGSLSAVTSRARNLQDFRARSRSFTGLTGYDAFYDQARYTLEGGGLPEQTTGVGVAHDFLGVLGVDPALGRGFTAEEGRFIGSLLYGVPPLAPVTLAAVTLGLPAMALISGWLPAARAARHDPATVLRGE